MGQLYLQHAFLAAGAASENFKDEAGAVQHLAFPFGLKIALLYGRKLGVDYHQLSFFIVNNFGDLCNLASADIGCGIGLWQGGDQGADNLQVNGFGQTNGLVEFACRIPVG